MNDWQEIVGGTWYSSAPYLLHHRDNHHFQHHHCRRCDSAHRNGSANSLLEVGGNGSGNASGPAGGNSNANGANSNRRVRCCIFSKRWLFFFLFHLGCLAMDHSTRELSYEEEEVRLLVDSSSSKAIKILGGGGVDGQPQLTSENSILSFHPSSLDFKDR